MKRRKVLFTFCIAAVLAVTSAFAAFADDMTVTDVDDMTASEFVTNNSAGVDRGDKDLGHIYIGAAITDGAVDEANSNWADRVTEEDGEFSITLNDDVKGEGFTAVRAFGDQVVNVTGNLNMSDEGDGTYDSDFTGMGAAVAAVDGTDMYVKDVNFYSEGIVRSFANVSGGNLFVENSTLTAMGANPFTAFYPDYCNTADTAVMISPPWVLGIQGAVRTINLLGQNSNLIVADSEVTSGGWAVFSTDIGSGPSYWIYNTAMNILPESKGGMNSGWKILGYDEDAYGSGYGAFLIGSAMEHFYGVDINGPTYAAIEFGGDAFYEGLKAGESYDALDADGNVIYTYTAAEDKDTVVNTVFGFLAQTAGTVTLGEGSVFNTAEAVALYKDANVNWVFNGAELNPASGIIIQMMDSDNGTIASTADGFDRYFYEEPGFPTEAYQTDASYVRTADSTVDPAKTYYAEAGENEYVLVEEPADEGTVAYFEKTTPGTYGTAVFSNGEYNGDIYNGTGYFGQAPDALDVTIEEDAVLNGDIAVTSHVHGIFLGGRNVDDVIAAIDEANAAHADITGYYGGLEDIEYVFLNEYGEVTENKDEAAALQFTKFTTLEYYLVGHVINMVYYNGASHLDVIVEGTWRPAACSLVTYLEIAEGAHVYGELTEIEDGSFLIAPSDTEIEPGVYGTRFVFVENPNGSSGGESAGEEAEEAESAEGESEEAEAPAEGESAEGESTEGESAEGGSPEGEAPAESPQD